MTPRTKKLIGLLVLLVWLAFYITVAGLIGAILARNHVNELVRFLYNALAGTLWIIPIGLMLPWMYREPISK